VARRSRRGAEHGVQLTGVQDASYEPGNWVVTGRLGSDLPVTELVRDAGQAAWMLIQSPDPYSSAACQDHARAVIP
jgi:hypothetical protein